MQTDEKVNELIRVQMRILQIIHLGLVGGLTTFVVITTFQYFNEAANGPPASLGSPMPYIAIGFATVGALASFAVPSLIAQQRIESMAQQLTTTPKPNDSSNLVSELMSIYNIKHIIGIAMLEGAGFFVTAIQNTHRVGWLLAIPMAVILLMLVRFPFLANVSDWIRSKLEYLGVPFD